MNLKLFSISIIALYINVIQSADSKPAWCKDLSFIRAEWSKYPGNYTLTCNLHANGDIQVTGGQEHYQYITQQILHADAYDNPKPTWCKTNILNTQWSRFGNDDYFSCNFYDQSGFHKFSKSDHAGYTDWASGGNQQGGG